MELINHFDLHVFVLDLVHRAESVGSDLLSTDVSLEGVTHEEDREVLLDFVLLFAVINRCLESESVLAIEYGHVTVTRQVKSVDLIKCLEKFLLVKSEVN